MFVGTACLLLKESIP